MRNKFFVAMALAAILLLQGAAFAYTLDSLDVKRNITLGPRSGATITLYGATGNIVTSGTITATGGIVGGVSEGTFADGNAAAPGMTFGSDNDNGFYRIGANNVGLSIGGAKKWDFGAATSALTGILTVSGNATVGGTLGVTGIQTNAGLTNLDGGLAMDTSVLTIANTTGVLSSVPTTTTANAWTLDFSTLTTGNGLLIKVDDDPLAGGKALNILGGASADTTQFNVAEGGVVYSLGAITATGGLDTGTGYAGTGATLSAAGALQLDSTLTVAGASTLVGNTAITGSLTTTGASSLNGGLTVVGATRSPILSTASETGATATIGSTYYGKTIFFSYAGAVAVTLPAAGEAAGSWFRCVNATSDTCAPVYAAPVADTLVAKNNATADSVTFGTGQRIGSSVLFISNGANWIAINENGACTMTVTDP